MRQEIVILVGMFALVVGGASYEVLKPPSTISSIPSAAADADVASTGAPAEVQETATPDTYDRSFTGKVEELPPPAKSVLNFVEADSENQTQGISILDRIISECGYGDYAGSGEFPGSIKVDPPEKLGWVKVSWMPGSNNCLGFGPLKGVALAFKISADGNHIKYIGGANGPSFFLTH